MNEIESIIKSWPIITGIVLLIAWLVRLEAKVMYLDKDHSAVKELNIKREETMVKKFDDLSGQLSLALQSLAKIEGKLEGHNGKDL